jgi:hypothetical protein
MTAPATFPKTEILPTQKSRTLAELTREARGWDAEFSEIESAASDCFDLQEYGLILGGNRLPVDQETRRRLLAKAGAPVSYLSDRSINIQMLALQEHLQQGVLGRTPRAVLRNGRLFTIQRSDLVELTHFEVLTVVADALGENAECLSLSRIDYADGNLELELVSPTKTREIRRGDVVKAGLHVEHCRYGEPMTRCRAWLKPPRAYMPLLGKGAMQGMICAMQFTSASIGPPGTGRKHGAGRNL